MRKALLLMIPIFSCIPNVGQKISWGTGRVANCWDFVIVEDGKEVMTKRCGKEVVVLDSAGAIKGLVKVWIKTDREKDSLQRIIWKLERRLNHKPSFL